MVKFREVKYTEVTSDSPKNTREKLMTLILKLISSYTYFRHQQDKQKENAIAKKQYEKNQNKEASNQQRMKQNSF